MSTSSSPVNAMTLVAIMLEKGMLTTKEDVVECLGRLGGAPVTTAVAAPVAAPAPAPVASTPAPAAPRWQKGGVTRRLG